MSEWQVKHMDIICDFLAYLNNRTNSYILKGGTALMTCYGLDRFSEDIDLDHAFLTTSHQLKSPPGLIITAFCQKNNYQYRVAKDTDVVKRYMINYGNIRKPLKVEISYRKKEIPSYEINTINNINVYNINTLCIMKSMAYGQRDKIRDLYDLAFIYNKYREQLKDSTIIMLREVFSFKGLENFDYLLETQSDVLIDKDKLTNAFLQMYNGLGLLYPQPEKEEPTAGAQIVEQADPNDRRDRARQNCDPHDCGL